MLVGVPRALEALEHVVRLGPPGLRRRCRRVVRALARTAQEHQSFARLDGFRELLEERGIELVRGVLRAEDRAVLELYRASGGPIYNG